ncbi:cold-shock protein [Candidatus Woesearchaeota archaeon]|nr:cold-shock protein [Candidatus Woesearchaeota archaeon]
MSNRIEGTVKFFNRKKGFGFISGSNGQDYFVHFTAVPRGVFLRDNDRVSFEAVEGDRGLKAENVQLLQKGSERTDIPQTQESSSGRQQRDEEPAEDDSAETQDEESSEEDEEPLEEEEQN